MQICIHCNKIIGKNYVAHNCEVWGKVLDTRTDLADFREVPAPPAPEVVPAPELPAPVEPPAPPPALEELTSSRPPLVSAPVTELSGAEARPLVKAPSEVVSAPPKDLSRDLAQGPRFRVNKKPTPTLAAVPTPAK